MRLSQLTTTPLLGKFLAKFFAKFLVAAGLAILLSIPLAMGDEPTVDYIFPAGGQRGTKVEFRVGGNNLHSRAQFEMIGLNVNPVDEIQPAAETVWFDGPLLSQPSSSRKEDYPKDYDGDVEIGSSAELGVRRWRVSTSQGITASRPFIVGELPEVVEAEIDGEPLPVAVTLPTTINGRIFPREDIDIWTFQAASGKTYSCEVMAARLGSPLDSRLEIRDPAGRLVTENTDYYETDSLCGFTAQADGIHSVRIHDVNFSGMQSYVYRLTIREGPYVKSIFPLGGRAGTTPSFLLDGFGVADEPVELPLAADGTGVSSTLATLPAGVTNPFSVAIGNYPEYIEDVNAGPTSIVIPAILNGRINLPSEVDRWTVQLNKGKLVSFGLVAAKLGSHLDAVLTLYDTAGEQLATADDSAGSTDATLNFTAPEDGEYVVAVADQFKSRGGPQYAYRLTVEPNQSPDFELTLPLDALTLIQGETAKIKLVVTRRGGFSEEIAVRIDGLPEGVTFAPDKIGKGGNDAQLTFTSTAETQTGLYPLSIVGTAQLSPSPKTDDKNVATPETPNADAPAAEAPAEVAPVDRIARQPVEGADDRLVLGVGVATPFKLVGIFETKYAARGATFVRKYSLERNGFEGPITIKLADRQARHLQGVTGPTIVVPSGKSDFEYPIQMATKMELARTSRTCLAAIGELTDAAGKKHTISYTSHQQNDQIIILTDPEQFVVSVKQSTILFAPNGQVDLEVTVGRGAGFDQPVELQLIPPAHIQGVSAISLSLPSSETTATMKLQFDQQSGPFNMPLTLRATTFSEGLRYIADAEVTVVQE
ncbi:MAG: hypothetical protein ACI9G1_002433 [Pirellulaceae bacterium]|jgi:hypothetical protein